MEEEGTKDQETTMEDHDEEPAPEVEGEMRQGDAGTPQGDTGTRGGEGEMEAGGASPAGWQCPHSVVTASRLSLRLH